MGASFFGNLIFRTLSPFGFVESGGRYAFFVHPGGAFRNEVGRFDQNQLDGDGCCQGWGATVCHQVGWESQLGIVKLN